MESVGFYKKWALLLRARPILHCKIIAESVQKIIFLTMNAAFRILNNLHGDTLHTYLQHILKWWLFKLVHLSKKNFSHVCAVAKFLHSLYLRVGWLYKYCSERRIFLIFCSFIPFYVYFNKNNTKFIKIEGKCF